MTAEEQELFERLTTRQGKRGAMYSKEELEANLKANPDFLKSDGNPTFERISHIYPNLNDC